MIERATMRHSPRLVPVVLATAAFPALFVIGRFVPLLHLGPGDLGRDLLGELALLVITVAIVACAGWWRETGLAAPWRQPLWTMLPLALLTVDLLLDLPGAAERADPSRVPAALLLAAMVGVCEETLTRGVMLYRLSRFGPLAAGLVSAAIFAVLHGLGYFDGLPVSFLFVQIITAALLGLLFAGMRLRMLTIWPLVVVHAGLDVPALIAGYPNDVQPVAVLPALVSIGFLLPFGMAGLGLLLWDQLTSPSRSSRLMTEAFDAIR
jgi:uncharacterized protein